MINLTDVEEQSFGPLPAGVYYVQAMAAEVKDTQSGNGQFINLELKVIEGKYENRNLWTRFNIQNESVKAQEIGLGQLKSFLIKSGFKDPNHLGDVNDLIGLKVFAAVTVRKDEGYGEQNDIRYWKTKEDVEGAPGATEFAPSEGKPGEVPF